MSVNLGDCRTSRMPDDGDQNFGWTIKRAPTDSVLKLIILSNDILGIRTHFFRGRTCPCYIGKCEACEHNQLSRWKGYVLAVEQPSGAQCVFEFTPPAARTLDEARKKYGTMRGIQLYVARASKKPNAKVTVTVKGITVLGPTACPDYNVWPIVAHIWGLTEKAPCIVNDDEILNLSEYEKQA